MRYSTLFAKTRREVPKDIESTNAQLLMRGGFVEPMGAGIYAWLPLGLRVLRRVEAIVREEMNALGAQEVLMPALHPREYWDKTGRWSTVDVLFRTTSQTEKEYALGASHEEIVTPLVQRFVQSYRDLPVAVYQIQTKFRDELRAKGGVLRGREFGMKDLYSFHATREDLAQFYDRVLAAYARVYDRCGVASLRARASGGIFTERVSDEFHVETPSGEDTLLRCAGCRTATNAEVADNVRTCATCGGALTPTRGIEVGNTFDLDTKYADAFGFTFRDADGVARPVIMGCYGIGTTRLVGAVVEANHDDRGMIWPAGVAPYTVHLAPIPAKQDVVTREVFAAAEAAEEALDAAGVEVLFDDRTEVAAGVKFADADLIGIPWRVVVSERSLTAGGYECRPRAGGEPNIVPLDALLPALGASGTLQQP